MEAYKKWVRRNRDYVHSMESLANGLTWLLPERFSASEIGPEAVTAFLGIITSINQHIIENTPTKRQVNPAESFFPWSLCISTIKDLETLVEVVAEHFYGDEKKWSFMAFTEAIKALVRLALFRDSGYKMLLQGGEVMNVEKHLNSSEYHENGNLMKPGGHHGPVHFWNKFGQDMRNPEGRALFALNKFGENARMATDPTWLKRLQHHQALAIDVKPSALSNEKPSLSTIWSTKGLSGGLFLTAEVLFIIRPLIYVLLIRKYGVRSWTPWLISLTVDLTGHGFLSQVTNERHRESSIALSSSEKDEVRRRKLLWVLYLMRDPFFSKYTRRHLEHADKILNPVPLIGFLSAKFVELLFGAQTRYTYISGS